MPAPFEEPFPQFARYLASGRAGPVDDFGPPATAEEVEAAERELGVSLPQSYKSFLLTAGSVFIGGGFQMGVGHLFFHEAPPSAGMLCFAEYWLEGDGDQALFDVSRGLVDGEYPVFSYNHDAPSVRKLADGFAEFIEQVVSAGETDSE